MSEKYVVLFDLDGTLANIDHRRHLVEGEKTNAKWREFYAACVNDTVNYPVYAMWKALAKYERWIVSGRSDEVREQTMDWLLRNDMSPYHILMRRADDHRPDVKLKQKWLLDGTIPKARVLCVFDDRSSVVAMWRAEGLACFQVAPGDF